MLGIDLYYKNSFSAWHVSGIFQSASSEQASLWLQCLILLKQWDYLLSVIYELIRVSFFN